MGMLAACTTDDDPGAMNGANGNDGEKTLTQLAITVSSTPGTRAVTGETGSDIYGEDSEYKISNLMVIFADQNGYAQQIFTPDLKSEQNIGSDKGENQLCVTEPFKASPGDYYIYVIANYNAEAFSQAIGAQTNLKQVFDIDNVSKLYTANAFMMANTTAPISTTIENDSADDTEIKADGTNETDGETVQLIAIDIERMVAKVTCSAPEAPTITVKDGEGADAKTLATATPQGAGLINLNKKMYLVKDNQKATNKPTGSSTNITNWAYPKDPNYETVLAETTDNSTWLAANFNQTSVTTFSNGLGETNAKFYCPENTMTAQAQQTGQTTGVVYKVLWKPDATNGYTTLSKDGTDDNSKKFKAVLDYASKDSKITDAIFNAPTATSGEENNEGTTFYTCKLGGVH